MDCESCPKLLAAYELAVSLYTMSVQEIRPPERDDFSVAYPKAKSLEQARQERHKAWMARGALMEHWHHEHGGLAALPGPGNEFCLVSQRAEQLRRACRDADDALIAHGAKSTAAFG